MLLKIYTAIVFEKDYSINFYYAILLIDIIISPINAINLLILLYNLFYALKKNIKYCYIYKYNKITILI